VNLSVGTESLPIFKLYLDDPQGINANCGDKKVIGGLRWYGSDSMDY